MKTGLCVVFFFVFGVCFGQFDIIPHVFLANLLEYTLYVLLVAAGVGLGMDIQNFSVLRTAGLRIFFLPLSIILGTVLGAVAAWGVLYLLRCPLTLRDAIGVSAGLGYYSLSSMIITRFGSAELGAVALLANISREIFTLICTPFLVKIAGSFAPIASGAATSMDTCLPVIAQFSGERYAIWAVFSGMVLTALVPVLVTMVFTYF